MQTTNNTIIEGVQTLIKEVAETHLFEFNNEATRKKIEEECHKVLQEYLNHVTYN